MLRRLFAALYTFVLFRCCLKCYDRISLPEGVEKCNCPFVSCLRSICSIIGFNKRQRMILFFWQRGDTALDVAVKKGHTEVAQLLRNHFASAPGRR